MEIESLRSLLQGMISSQYPVLAGEQEMMPHLDSSQMHAGLGNFSGPQTSAAEQEADPRKLCILGLPWDTTDETLQNYFSQFGPLEVINFFSELEL